MRTWTERAGRYVPSGHKYRQFEGRRYSDWHMIDAEIDGPDPKKGWPTICGGAIPDGRCQEPGEANVDGRVCIPCLHALIGRERARHHPAR